MNFLSHGWWYMKITGILYVVMMAMAPVLQASPGFAQALKKRITVSYDGISMQEAIADIQSKAAVDFGYVGGLGLEKMKVAKVAFVNETLDHVLKGLFKGRDVSFNERAGAIILSHRQSPGRISGQVLDEQGQPLVGANVRIPELNQRIGTDADGRFSFSVPPGTYSIEVSYVSYAAQRKENVLVEEGKQLAFVFSLKAERADLDEVVVVGYGVQKKVNLTGSVDNITANRLAALQVNNIGEALQSKLPGVYVDIVDGKPGRGASFNIRGNTSLNGGSPLIVIDGVQQTDVDLNNISPFDIEEISVLKDAASSAIYGARASFGVILITTKKGKKDEGVDIEYSDYFGFSTPTIVPEVYDNPVDYLDINNEFNTNIGQSYWTDAQLEYPKKVAQDPSLPFAQVTDIGGRANLLLGGVVHNYYKEWMDKYSPEWNHRLSVNGGGKKMQYYLSGDYNYEQGAIKFKPEKINRYTFRSNVNYKVSDHVSLFNYTTMVKRDEELPNQYLYGFTSNVYRFIENSWPMMPEYVDVDGQRVPTDIGFYRQFLTDQSDIQQGSADAKSTLGMELSFLNNDLKVHVDGTYQYRAEDKLRWWDNAGPYLSNSFNNRNIVLDAYSDAGPATIYRSRGATNYSNVNAYATYEKRFGNHHHLTAMAGYNQERYDYLYVYAEKIDPLAVAQHALNLATGNSTVKDDDDRNASRSVFSRLNYDWDNKYLLEVNGSYFLTSRFAEKKRGHGFIAASGAWRVSEEAFFKPLKPVINELKLRGSYGSIGNANIGSYDYLSILSVAQSDYTLEGSRVNYTSVPAPKSPNFTWETVRTAGLGLDVAALNNRLTATLDVYQRNTLNMLANFRSLPSVFGATVPKENIAALRNRGWELSLAWSDHFSLDNSPFQYGLNFNISDYKSVITDYYNPTNYLQDYYVGQELGEIWGLTTLGYFKTDEEAKNSPLLATSSYKAYAAAGTIKFEDRNGDGTISWADRTLSNPGDYHIIGNSTPRYQYGINLSGSWKGFDLNAFFRGVGKMDIYPGAEATNFWGPYNRKYQIMPKHVVENRWTPEHPDAYFPRPQGYIALGSSDLGVPQTKYLQDASFIRLKNLTLGYTLSRPFAKLPLKSVRLYVAGQNLWEKTNLDSSLDPEGLEKDPDASTSQVGVGTAYPIQRVYTFGLQARF